MTNVNAVRFWKDYVVPIIPEITSGQKWYDFSLGTLRTFDELGLVRKHENGLEITYGDYTFSTDQTGYTYMLTSNQPNADTGVQTYVAPSSAVKRETFIVSLPKISFHP